VTAPAYPNLHRIAYGEGARLTAEARVEAADALERINRTCATCADHLGSPREPLGTCLAADPSGDPDQPFVVAVGVLYVRPDFACNAWQPIPLTSAHDKEKS